MRVDRAGLLLAAGVLGGLVNAVAGGATLITFPAMLAAGLPAVAANASNAVAILPGHLIAAFADRGKLPPPTGRTMTFVAVALAGGTVGAVLLLQLPERLFTLPGPALIAFATLLFTVAPRLQAWSESRRGPGEAAPFGLHATCLAGACLYGGFFGAGLGVILTAGLSITEPNDIRAVKALKNLLASCVALAASVIFIVQDAVRWPETGVMLAGAIAGGYGGGLLIRVLSASHVRRIVIGAGTAMTILYARRYWLS